MKKFIAVILTLLAMVGISPAQDTTLTNLTELSTATSDDLFYIVDVTGPLINGRRARKITLENLALSLVGIGIGFDEAGNYEPTGTWDWSGATITWPTTITTTTFVGSLTGNASTATALAANPTDCSANQFANAIAASGNLTCAALTDADVPDTITASSYLPLAGGTLTGAVTNTKVNAAGSGVDILTFSGTLGIMNGSKNFRGIYFNYTNADHTGSNNTLTPIWVGNITGDAETNEIGTYVGTGWDYGFSSSSPYAALIRQPFYFFDTDSDHYIAWRSPDTVTTSLLFDWPATIGSGTANMLVCNGSASPNITCSWATSLSGLTIGGFTASNAILSDASGNLTSAGFNFAGTATKTYTFPTDSATIPANNQTMYIGTTATAINRSSAAQTIAGLTLTTPDIGAATGTSLALSGTMTGLVKVVSVSSSCTIGTDCDSTSTAIAYGGFLEVTGAATITLPAVTTGMSLCIYIRDAAEEVSIDPNASDGIRNGTAARNADGHKITSTGVGNFACLIADSADGWTVLGSKGTWTDE